MTGLQSPKYTSIVGSKFEKDGSARRYPGNTIICPIDSESVAHDALVSIQNGLKSGSFEHAFTFLPAQGFHMTLYRGVNDELRVPNEWPRDIPLDTPLDEVTDIFRNRIADVTLPDAFRMRPTRLANSGSGESQLFLEPLDPSEARKLTKAVHTLRQALNHRRTGDDNYQFHITFSYQIKHLSRDQKGELQKLNIELFRYFAGNLNPLNIGAPKLCRYDNMLQFVPVFQLSPDGQNHI
jgi:hypothetical protein